MTTPRFQFQALPDWRLRITEGSRWERILPIEPVEELTVTGEKHDHVPLFTEEKWRAGTRFSRLIADECSISHVLAPDSVRIIREDGTRLRNGIDFLVDPVWGAFGRMEDSAFGENDTVDVSYCWTPLRLDSIVRRKDGSIVQKKGKENGATPLPPKLSEDEELLCNLFFDRRRGSLADSMIFPFLEPWKPQPRPAETERSLAGTLKKLRSGRKVRLLAWGDSVTACRFIADPEQRWPRRFQRLLQKRFPTAEIELIELGWGGKAINTFQCEPPDSPWNYQKKVVESGADLVILEFVNDAYLTMKPEFDRIYNRVRDDFRAKGMELLVIVPHFVRPDWMGLTSQKEIESDPRPYVTFLRNWIKENQYACADLSRRFQHLWKEGIPYNTLMRNHINHPDLRGVDLYFQALADLFPER